MSVHGNVILGETSKHFWKSQMLFIRQDHYARELTDQKTLNLMELKCLWSM